MAFIVIEAHGGPEYAVICTTYYGVNEIFYTLEDAEEYAENVQDPRIVEI
jgi:hypothetical protein